MKTTKTQLQYITAALMFLLLAVFLIDNPIKGSFEETNGHQDMALYMCIFYAITTAWFWNNTLDQKTKSKIFVIGAVIGLAGVIGQFISYNMDFKEVIDAIHGKVPRDMKKAEKKFYAEVREELAQEDNEGE